MGKKEKKKEGRRDTVQNSQHAYVLRLFIHSSYKKGDDKWICAPRIQKEFQQFMTKKSKAHKLT